MSEHCCCGHDHEHEEHVLPHEENESDIITLVDDEGVEHEFEIADVLEDGGTYYMALIPHFDTAEELLDDTGELVVLKVVAEGAKEYLESIDDEQEFNRISKLFVERLSDEYDFEE